jgi:hypothetical protein
MIVVARFASELRACGVGWDHAIARVEEIVEAESITRMSCNIHAPERRSACLFGTLLMSFLASNTRDMLMRRSLPLSRCGKIREKSKQMNAE